ncbi:hypothetical protein LTR36_002748 [Oleoguttula mirabilis]|uniref:Uncharacterized protein n=1 Tax=Oleoguttula mirabilis TaxID=1507867 RepID=A0AAV9JLM9_9PEZI|nr:hypothetical protein LTR36_002748 [Oleoguttula mirabilis]
MVNQIELRVHAGAPSRRTDDDRYRAQADAYLDFVGWVRQPANAPRDHDNATAQDEMRHAEPTDDELDLGVEETQVDMRHGGAIDDSTTVVHHDATTWVEDTQLAYTALESQIFTSSLTIPDVTPATKRRSSDADDTSPWPEDLDRHSPEEEVDQLIGYQNATRPLSSPPNEQASHSPAQQQPASYGLGKKRKVVPAPTFKPFKLPLKRRAADNLKPREPTREIEVRSQQDETVSQTESLSSYLKTPILDRSAVKRRRLEEGLQDLSEHREFGELRPSSAPVSPLLERSGKKPKLNDYREHTPQVRPFIPCVPLQEGSQVGLAFIGEHAAIVTPERAGGQRQSQVTGDGDETTSELPTTYSLSDLTSQSERARLRASQRSTSDPGPSLAASGHPESPPRSSSHPPLHVSRAYVEEHQAGEERRVSESPDWAKRKTAHDCGQPAGKLPGHGQSTALRHLKAKAAETSSSLPPPSSPEAVHDRRPFAKDTSNDDDRASKSQHVNNANKYKEPPSCHNAALKGLKKLPLTIRPPEPAVSLKTFTTHVTETLRFLAEDSVVTDHYTPVAASRDLRPLERGYWLVNTSTWSPQVQLDFWQFLQQMIGSGNVGWGVWCVREETMETNRPLASSEGVDVALGEVKVFCWGEIVKHVYLMLYVASKSKVRKLGLQWIDAEARAVVQMRGGSA